MTFLAMVATAAAISALLILSGNANDQ